MCIVIIIIGQDEQSLNLSKMPRAKLKMPEVRRLVSRLCRQCSQAQGLAGKAWARATSHNTNSIAQESHRQGGS